MSYIKLPKKESSSASKKSAAKVSAGGEASWTFLTNHAHTLILLAAESELPLREVALRVGITERAVQRIVAELEVAGMLTRERVGRNNRYTVDASAHLRHPVESHRTVGDLLKLAKR
jgi:DNA-binding transcriptional ArsR family regulator